MCLTLERASREEEALDDRRHVVRPCKRVQHELIVSAVKLARGVLRNHPQVIRHHLPQLVRPPPARLVPCSQLFVSTAQKLQRAAWYAAGGVARRGAHMLVRAGVLVVCTEYGLRA